MLIRLCHKTKLQRLTSAVPLSKEPCQLELLVTIKSHSNMEYNGKSDSFGDDTIPKLNETTNTNTLTAAGRKHCVLLALLAGVNLEEPQTLSWYPVLDTQPSPGPAGTGSSAGPWTHGVRDSCPRITRSIAEQRRATTPCRCDTPRLPRL